MTTLGLNAAFALGEALLGVRIDPYVSFNFFVEFEGLIVGGFSEVRGLDVETVVETYREGGLNEYEHKLAGPTRYPGNLVLRHGLTAIDSLWSWHQDVIGGKIKRKNGSVYILNRDRLPAMWWDVRDAYPVRWTGPELRADSNTVAFETLELAHRGISRPPLNSLLAGLTGLLGGDIGVTGGLSL